MSRLPYVVSALTLAACLATPWVTPAYAGSSGFSLSSTEIKPGQSLVSTHVFKGFGCEGGNQSPALSWTAGPEGTRSYAVTMYDPDAPTGSGWWHWVVYNIPASVTHLEAGAGDTSGAKLPAGAMHGRTDFGAQGFGGACPPVGDKPHRYIFTVYALKADRLEVQADASAALIGYMIHATTLAKATLKAKYAR